MGIRLAVVLALPLLLAGCGDEGAGSSDTRARPPLQLDGTSWIGTRIIEGGAPRALVDGSQLRVEFRDGSISIHAGCNHLGGSYELSDSGALSTGELSSTEMGCEPPLMDQDTWLSGTVFAQPLLAAVDGDHLTLSREGLELVLTDRAVVAPDAALRGTAWQLDGIRTGDSVSSVPAGHTPTLTIAEDGTVSLHTGCNGGHGTARVSADSITFGQLMTTKMACADDAGRQTEASVLAVLDGEVSWSVTEQTLTVTKGDRGLVYRSAS